MTQFFTLPLRLSNALLVVGERPVLIDAGSPGEGKRILRGLSTLGVEPQELAAIVLTHAHTDHAGAALALREASGAPVYLHPADGDMLARGVMGPLRPLRFRHRLLLPIVDHPFPGLRADKPLEDGDRLDGLGLSARVVHTPGHSAGSVSLVFDDGDAVVGDLVIGGLLGGLIAPAVPRLPYFAEDVPLLKQSIGRMLDEAPGVWRLGHGGPVRSASVRRRELQK
ncbi:putative metallo-hydrolase YflN [Pirellulimonas nuda]|uniref:Putative metallo-hydrolase YflN n=1 Tax=Pirellulimonas nuda TaxID=2528009 RepID=A0A518D7X9_9BACT|nr:MBL fold metallo-hydrolase [Pirellulimonas nuda]QDU87573.1 putative metallo-hydrolase YflN [Pirellulimonas nuda]